MFRLGFSVFFFVLFSFFGTLRAATHLQQEKIQLLIDSVVYSKAGAIQSLTISLFNQGDQPFDGNLILETSEGLSIVGESSRAISLEQGGKRFLPVRVRVENDAPAGQITFHALMQNAEGKTIAIAPTVFHIEKNRNVVLQAMTQRELIQYEGDSLRIPIRIYNIGNTDENVRVVSSIPQFATRSERRFDVGTLFLRASQDTTLVLGYQIDRDMLRQDHFMINISALFENGDLLGNAQVVIQNAAAKKTFLTPYEILDYWAHEQNKISLISRNVLSPQPSLQLLGTAGHLVGKGEIEYSFNIHQWGLDQTPSINNTWFSYDQENKGFTVGNLSENLDKYVYGRGLKVHLGDTAVNHRTELGLVDKAYSLLGNDHGQEWFDAYTVFLRSQGGMKRESRRNWSSLALYDRDPRENNENLMYYGTFNWIKNPEIRSDQLQLMWGTGIARPLVQTSHTDTLFSGDFKPSLALGINYNTTWKGFQLSSSNYYSSGYYPGARKGVTQLYQRVSKNMGAVNVWGNYSYSEYEPQLFHLYHAYRNHQVNTRAELGAGFSVGRFVHMNFSPRLETEKGVYMVRNLEAETLFKENLRLNSMITWRSRSGTQFSTFISEIGHSTRSSFTNLPFLHHRQSLSYQFKRLSFTGLYQQGNFTIMEQLFSVNPRAVPKRTNLTVNWSNEFLNRRLQLQTGLAFASDQNSGESMMAQSRIEYIHKKTAFTALFQMSQFHNDTYFSGLSTTLQLGITQKLPDNRISGRVRRGQIGLFLYFDHNNNGVFDQGDIVAENKSALIENTLFQANDKGEIHYSRVPRGSYSLVVPLEKGWYAPQRTLHLESNRLRLEIPLSRAATLKGMITYDFDPRLSLEANTILEGFTVRAKSDNGYATFTRTDNLGQYSLNLPEGNYEIYIDERELPTHVYTDSPVQTIRIEPGKANTLPAFVFKVKERQIEIKRFGT